MTLRMTNNERLHALRIAEDCIEAARIAALSNPERALSLYREARQIKRNVSTAIIIPAPNRFGE